MRAVAETDAAAGRHLAGLRAAEAGHLVQDGATGRRVGARVAWGLAEEGRRAGVSDRETWAGAANALEAVGEPYLAACCRYREAELAVTGPGGRAHAEAVLRETRAWAARTGAAPLLRDVESLARRARLELSEPSRAPDGPPTSEEHSPAPVDPYGLSSREREVLALLVEGCTNRQIGAALFITEKTASAHVTHILDKLGVASRGAAAALAARGGLVAGPEA
jgi:DNA-binding CsgD family transcriptional regulator